MTIGNQKFLSFVSNVSRIEDMIMQQISAATNTTSKVISKGGLSSFSDIEQFGKSRQLRMGTIFPIFKNKPMCKAGYLFSLQL